MLKITLYTANGKKINTFLELFITFFILHVVLVGKGFRERILAVHLANYAQQPLLLAGRYLIIRQGVVGVQVFGKYIILQPSKGNIHQPHKTKRKMKKVNACLQITMKIKNSDRQSAAKVYFDYRQPFLDTIDGALTKSLLCKNIVHHSSLFIKFV